MDFQILVDELEGDLRAVADEVRAVGAKAYLKSDLEFIGVSARPLRSVVRVFLGRYPELDRVALRGLVADLWERPVFELRAAAVAVLERKTSSLNSDDLVFVEGLLRRSHTWALVDWLCTKVAAPLVERDPGTAESILRRWSMDGDFWIRRSALLAQLPALRAGRGDFGLFASFAASMLGEREFFVRKAIGWVLRDVSRKRPQLVYDFVDRHLGELSALTFREAVKYLPEEQAEDLRSRRN